MGFGTHWKENCGLVQSSGSVTTSLYDPKVIVDEILVISGLELWLINITGSLGPFDLVMALHVIAAHQESHPHAILFLYVSVHQILETTSRLAGVRLHIPTILDPTWRESRAFGGAFLHANVQCTNSILWHKQKVNTRKEM
ncbi:hypothetical protein VNO77_14870 [Canavalia gladiata]|uniref:Uncharacterized protein n=1 Tax=Canavalia gladiata TaxID=3824 RepID=A0AAN9M3B0_CANGL